MTELEMRRGLTRATRLASTALLFLLGWASWPATIGAQAPPSDILAALRSRNVYEADAARPRMSEEARAGLEAYAAQRSSGGHLLKIAVLDRPPLGFRTLGQFVEAAHSALDLGDGILIAVALDTGAGTGSVSAKTNALDDDTIQQLQRANLGAFTAGSYADGFRALADDLIQEIDGRRARARTSNQVVVLGLVLAALAVAGFWLVGRVNAWKTELAAATALRESLYPLLRRLDDDLPYAGDGEDAQRASKAGADGSECYERGSEVLDQLAGTSWLHSALPGSHQQQLEQATLQLTRARQHLIEANAALDRATPSAGRASQHD